MDNVSTSDLAPYQLNTNYKSRAFNEIIAPIQWLAPAKEGHENLIYLVTNSKTVFKATFLIELGEYCDAHSHALNTSTNENNPALGWWLSHNFQKTMDEQA